MTSETGNWVENVQDYVHTPQNDKVQIEQVAILYETDPAKGLAHGVQKDAIQNGVGARLSGKEPRTYEDWKFTFKLFKIDGNYALSFWDKGTTGLTGEILSVSQIEEWSSDGKLTAEQNLSRFLTRFDSGGNLGPGSFGRGKLIFQAASKTGTIVCDSLRRNDNKYVAFSRTLRGNALVQPEVPYVDAEAIGFLEYISKGQIAPLSAPGTRVTILDLKMDIVNAIKTTFKERNNSNKTFGGNFADMIEETWWEILDKFDAKIYIEYGDLKHRVELQDPIQSIAKKKDGEGGWQIYTKKNLTVVVQNEPHTIKELKFAICPERLPEDLSHFWVQRKRMKIGNVDNYITPHRVILGKICGYVILSPELENIVLEAEGLTHYGFNSGRRGVRNIRDTIRSELEKFQKRLGLSTASEPGREHHDMLNALKEINESAKDLGLKSTFGTGVRRKDVELSISYFQLPNRNSPRIDFDQDIGPIEFEIRSRRQFVQNVELFVTLVQKGSPNLVKIVSRREITLEPKETEVCRIEPFQVSQGEFRPGEAVTIQAKLLNADSGDTICKTSRVLWLGTDEPPRPEVLFTVTAFKLDFPREKSNRVEMSESIRNIRFSVSNNTAVDATLNIDLVVRKAKSPTSDVRVLQQFLEERGFVLPAMSDKSFAYEGIVISPDVFGGIHEAPADPDERTCEIFFSVRSAENNADLNLLKGASISKKIIPFLLGIDPPGHSIFRKTVLWDDPKDGKRSKHSGDAVSGYVFHLNRAHPSAQLAFEYDQQIKQSYLREQMLQQAFLIAVSSDVFEGVLEEFSDYLNSEDLSKSDTFALLDEVIGKAIIELS